MGNAVQADLSHLSQTISTWYKGIIMNQAGKSTREMAQRRRRITNLILIGVLIVGIILFLIIQKWQALGLSGGTVLVLLVILRVLPDFIDKPIKRRIKAERRADRGAAAEEVIGELLSDLGEDFFVLNDITSSYGNIDHIVIGKNNGVFLIETKAHGGRVEILSDGLKVNEKPPEKDFIAQALNNTYWLRGEIEKVTGNKVWITPVLVFTNAFVPAGKPIRGVYVVNKKFLPNILHRSSKSSTDLLAVWDMRWQLGTHLGAK
jgi:hypothetical protein